MGLASSPIWVAVKDTPKRLIDGWVDPVRRKHSISRILETFIPAISVTFSFWKAALIVLGEFLLYEWILEPLGYTGYYWERGPRDEEKFTRP